MTATEVAGKKVVAESAVKSPLWKPDRPVWFSNCMELMLEDGTVTYGCRWCDYTTDKIGQVRMHQSLDCLAKPREVMSRREKREANKRARENGVLPKEIKTMVTAVQKEAAKPTPATVAALKSVPTYDVTETAEEDAADILAALEAAFSTEPDADLKAEVEALKLQLIAAEGERDFWKAEAEKSVTSLGAIRDLLKKYGL